MFIDHPPVLPLFILYGGKWLLALLIGLIGFGLAKYLRIKLKQYLRQHTKDPTAQLFLLNALHVFLLVVFLIIVLTMIGVPTTTLTTVVAAGSLAVGLALKDSLANIAGGLLLVFLKLFKIGDLVEIDDILGTVNEISLFMTRIKTPNNEMVYFPNAKVMNNKVKNKAYQGLRRLDITIGISYSSNIAQAKRLIEAIFAKDSRILVEPKPVVVVKELGDNAVHLAIRPWIRQEHFSEVSYYLLEVIKETFDEQGIVIPFPQLDIRLDRVPLR